jgi:hypothetical protein
VYKHPGCLAEPEVAPPPPEVGQKFTHHFLQAHSLCPPRQFPHSLLKPDLRLRRNPPHHVCKEPPRQMTLRQKQPIISMLHQPTARLHQPLVQAGQGPIVDPFGQHRPPPQIAQVIGGPHGLRFAMRLGNGARFRTGSIWATMQIAGSSSWANRSMSGIAGQNSA